MNKLQPLLLIIILALVGCDSATSDENLLEELMKERKQQFATMLQNPDDLEVQIIYTQIDRDKENSPTFKSFYYHVNEGKYFYPASTVKLPMCILALEKLNRLQVPGLTLHTPMMHDSVYSGQLSVSSDSTSETGDATIAHYIKKILVVSDNDAYNRLYEFVGQKSANEELNSRGYLVRLLHRLERLLSPDENRHTEAVRFMRDGSIVYEQPMLFNEDSIRPPSRVFKGRGYMKDGEIVNEPFEFTYKNFYSLPDQQFLLRTLLFPESVDSAVRFKLTREDYDYLYKYMSQLPTETRYPNYQTDSAYYDAYCKFLMYGSERKKIPSSIRIFNKVGNAYGYLIDNAYIVDFDKRIEFMLSAVINVNTDGVYGDDNYEYESLGFPFMKNLGMLVYDYEVDRKRNRAPDLSRFRFTYDTQTSPW